jgi:hypothetical protein
VNRETLRRPSPGTAVAIAALVLAATPIADAATSGKKAAKVRVAAPVAHARYADNAGRLGGYRASFVPTPNSIVPLGADGKLPLAVIPRGVTGPPGPPGPRGPSGLNSPGVVTIVYQADGSSQNPTNGAAEANCPNGTKVLGGGFNDLTRTVPALAASLPAGSVDEVQENDPFARADGSSGWRVRIVNVPSPAMIDGSGNVVPNTLKAGSTYFQSYAICG